VFAVSHASLQHPLPMELFQMQEIMLTAAQSLLGLALLASLRLTISNAILLFALFIGQFVAPNLVTRYPNLILGLRPDQIHPLFTVLYTAVALGIIFHQPRLILGLKHGLDPVGAADDLQLSPLEDMKTEHCAACRWRRMAIPLMHRQRGADECDGDPDCQGDRQPR
jgi:hypothetical protein